MELYALLLYTSSWRVDEIRNDATAPEACVVKNKNNVTLPVFNYEHVPV
jgi:hypothetical protein